MTLYIVRHGQSEGNVGKRYQTSEEKLTKTGSAQAKLLAKRFKGVKIDRLIASSMTRAQQTAHEISLVTSVPVTSNPYFVELRQPSEVVGKTHTDQNSQTIMDELSKHREDPDYHYSDEENIFDFIKRLDAALNTIVESSSDDDVVVLVAHGYVIRVLLGLILFGTEFSPLSFTMLLSRVKTSNTGISIVNYHPENGWELVTFNDHAHLLE